MLLNLCLPFVLVITYSLNLVLVGQAQNDNPPGFISIDCGLPEDSDYNDTTTGIYYKSDSKLIDRGESQIISPSSNSPYKYFSTLRSFPHGNRNCYTLQPSPGKGYKYLIRASFMYGNYDNINQLPSFNLSLGVDIWDSIDIKDQSTPVTREIIHNLFSDYIHICLVKTGISTPFISALELRPLNTTNGMYTSSPGSLQTFDRINFDTITQTIRYKDDIYDRTWRPFTGNYTTVGTSFNINNGNEYLVPVAVMRTAITPYNTSNPFGFKWDTANTSDKFYIYMNFAEVVKLEANQSREFNVYINEKLWNFRAPIVPNYLSLTTYFPASAETGVTTYNVLLRKTQSSTLPPIINALEIYKEKNFSNLRTEETDVAAILSIKSLYGVTRNWQGDPCEPEDFLWDGLNCSYDRPDSARIISMVLSSSTLTGEIAPSIANLTKLKTLDLSYNNLSGKVPDFLSQLDLSVLNLKGNNFAGPFPAQLLEKSKNGSLELSFDDQANNTNIDCPSLPCKKRNKSSIIPIVGAVVGAIIGAVVLFATIYYILPMFRRRKQSVTNEGGLERRKQRFTYSEVQSMTDKFEKPLGEGSFGKVYYGRISNTQVAVKMLSQSSDQGYNEFQTEVTLLMSISHKNLTSLVGYCHEGSHIGIIYEYMANGCLYEHISERSNSVLGWEARLRIAMDAAHGLEYLHHGCKPAIIHRDVKPGNILLDEQFQGKLGDFGLSKAYSVEGGTHVSTIHVSGTPGYLDPDYSASKRLTVKSDVYSFGIVVLVMITGRPPTIILRNQEPSQIHITEWVASSVHMGDITQIADPRFRGEYNVKSVGKAVKLAMTCASKHPSARPTMKSVVIELNDCLATEISGD